MRVRFQNNEYRWLAVREKPNRSSRMVRKIETGCEFDVDDEITENEGDLWYPVLREPRGYVMAEFVEPADAGGKLQEMKLNELRKLAKDSGVKISTSMSKADIIEALIHA